jgi:hypothetical protein
MFHRSYIMRTILCAILILICFACQTGRIPCPDARGPKIHKVKVKNSKRFLEYTASISSQREGQDGKSTPQTKENEQRFVRNVSQDEWDCPKPGEKKYMPKSVKENIRKNMKRIRSADKRKNESDSLRTR